MLRAAHCDAIVVQGSEAAGPRSSFEDADDTEVGLSSLIPAVAAATKLPVIAAAGSARLSRPWERCLWGQARDGRNRISDNG